MSIEILLKMESEARKRLGIKRRRDLYPFGKLFPDKFMAVMAAIRKDWGIPAFELKREPARQGF